MGYHLQATSKKRATGRSASGDSGKGALQSDPHSGAVAVQIDMIHEGAHQGKPTPSLSIHITGSGLANALWIESGAVIMHLDKEDGVGQPHHHGNLFVSLIRMVAVKDGVGDRLARRYFNFRDIVRGKTGGARMLANEGADLRRAPWLGGNVKRLTPLPSRTHILKNGHKRTAQLNAGSKSHFL